MALHPMLQPFGSGGGEVFDSVKAGHLLNRAGFGGTAAEVAATAKAGAVGAVDELLKFPDASAEKQAGNGGQDLPDLSSIADYPRDFAEIRKALAGKSEQERMEYRQKLMAANREALVATSSWWMKRMVAGPWPLQEKLTLFWHGHFTTSARDERSSWLMWQQNELLRQFAAGNFVAFVKAVSRDPAMLDYLNNQQNRKQRPNENYARELMELFTLGIGNYSEQDIKEAARAFTGWGHEGDNYIFRRGDHDHGMKTFMGKTGEFDGDDIIDIIFQQKAAATYLPKKLFEFLAYEEPEEALVPSLGELFRQSKFELRPVLRTILTSKAFYSPRCIGGQIKSPVQLVVGTVRMLGAPVPGGRLAGGALQQMGQVPFYPPNVKGWPGGRAWINTSTLFVRQNAVSAIAESKWPVTLPAEAATPEQVVDEWLGKLIQRPIDPAKRWTLIDSVAGSKFKESDIKRLVALIVAMPEYQLC